MSDSAKYNITFCNPSNSMEVTASFANTFNEMDQAIYSGTEREEENFSSSSREHSRYCCIDTTGDCICDSLEKVEEFQRKRKMQRASKEFKAPHPVDQTGSVPSSSENSFHSAISEDILNDKLVESAHNSPATPSPTVSNHSDTGSGTPKSSTSSSPSSANDEESDPESSIDDTSYKRIPSPKQLNRLEVNRNAIFIKKLKTIIEDRTFHSELSGNIFENDFNKLKNILNQCDNIDTTVPTFDINHSILNLTQVNFAKNKTKNAASPLLISTLKNAQSKSSPHKELRAFATPSSPGSPIAEGINESSFTLHEKECGIVPKGVDSPPKKSIIDEKIEECIKLLNDSPVKSTSRKSILITDSETNGTSSSSSSNFLADFQKIPSTESESSSTSSSSFSAYSDDLTASIQYELALRQKRRLETEKALSEKTSCDIGGGPGKLNCTYKSEKPNKQSNEKSKIESNKSQRLEPKAPKSAVKTSKSSEIPKLTKRPMYNSTSKLLTPKRVEKPSTLPIPSSTSLVKLSTPRTPKRPEKSFTSSHVTSTSSLKSFGTPQHTSTIKTPNAIRKNLSQNAKDKSSTSVSKRTAATTSKLPSTPSQSSRFVCSIQPPTPRSTLKSSVQSTECKSAAKTNSNLQTPKSTSGLATKIKGFLKTPSKLSTSQSASTVKSPSLLKKSSLLSPRSPATAKHNGNLQKTPVSSIKKPSKLLKTSSSPSHPSESKKTTKFQFFPPNGETPLKRPKPAFYFPSFSPLPQVKSTLENETSRQIVVNSPVADYIHATDAQLIQNVRSTQNKNLLTPKRNDKQVRSSTENLKIKLAPKKINTETDFTNKENSENVSNILNLPEVSYHLPSKVYEITESPKKLACNNLLKPPNSQIIRHEGRIKPLDSSSDVTECSLYIKKSAEKTKVVLTYNSPRNHQDK